VNIETRYVVSYVTLMSAELDLMVFFLDGVIILWLRITKTYSGRNRVGVTAETAFDAVNRTIDSMTKTAVFFLWNLISCGEMAEQQ
jgi:hypothetical protein